MGRLACLLQTIAALVSRSVALGSSLFDCESSAASNRHADMTTNGHPGVPDVDFRGMYDAHFVFVWRALQGLGVYPSDAMDLAQKVFLKALIALPTFEGRSPIRTWLFGICRRVASDYRRSARLRHEVLTDSTDIVATDFQFTDDDESPSDSESRRKAALANSILNRLPEPQRVVFVLFELEDMSSQEIAALLNVSSGTVRSRLRLARERFRREARRQGAKDLAESKQAAG